MERPLKRVKIDEDNNLEDGMHEDNIPENDIHKDDKLEVNKLLEGIHEDRKCVDDIIDDKLMIGIHKDNIPEDDIHEDNIPEDDIDVNDIAEEGTSKNGTIEDDSSESYIDDSSESDTDDSSESNTEDDSSEYSIIEGFQISDSDWKFSINILSTTISKIQRESCEKELKKLKQNDLIRKLVIHAKRPYYLANPDTVAELEKLLEKSNLSKEFPIACKLGILSSVFKQSMTRFSLLKSAFKILSNDVFGSLNLPDIVVREIIEYLEDEELEILCGEMNNDEYKYPCILSWF